MALIATSDFSTSLPEEQGWQCWWCSCGCLLVQALILERHTDKTLPQCTATSFGRLIFVYHLECSSPPSVLENSQIYKPQIKININKNLKTPNKHTTQPPKPIDKVLVHWAGNTEIGFVLKEQVPSFQKFLETWNMPNKPCITSHNSLPHPVLLLLFPIGWNTSTSLSRVHEEAQSMFSKHWHIPHSEWTSIILLKDIPSIEN